MTQARTDAAGVSNGTRGCMCGGWVNPSPASNVIDYVTIASTGNATDFGDLQDAKKNAGASSGAAS